MTELADYHNPVDLLLDGARYGDLEDVETALHQYKVSVDAADDQGRTGLHMASANGHADIVRLLLERGANVGSPNQEGNTPLHWACLNGQTQVVSLLLENGASPSALNAQNNSPVDEALGRPFQDSILQVVQSFSQERPEERAAEKEDPEVDEDGMVVVTAETDPALQVYDKYGQGS